MCARYKSVSFVLILIITMPFVNLKQYNASERIDYEDEDYSDLYAQAPALVLKAHNTLRANLNLPPLKLQKELTALSREWAEKLATERVFYPSPHNEYGENIYRENYKTGLHYPALFVHTWYAERRFFRRNMRFSELHLVSNFTQIIWRSTEYLGVGAVVNADAREIYLVCMYDPPGNIVDEYLKNIDVDSLIPELEVNLPKRYSVSVRLRINVFLMLIILVPMSNIILK